MGKRKKEELVRVDGELCVYGIRRCEVTHYCQYDGVYTCDDEACEEHMAQWFLKCESSEYSQREEQEDRPLEECLRGDTDSREYEIWRLPQIWQHEKRR